MARCSAEQAVGGGTVLSEVLREYNDLGMLTKEYQEHNGVKDANTPYVQVNSDETAVSGELTKGMRLKSVRYPTAVWYFTYGSSGSDADNLNRLDAIKSDSGGNPGTTLASYTYLGAEGAGTVVEIDYEEPDVRLLIGSGHAYSGSWRGDPLGRLGGGPRVILWH